MSPAGQLEQVAVPHTTPQASLIKSRALREASGPLLFYSFMNQVSASTHQLSLSEQCLIY